MSWFKDNQEVKAGGRYSVSNVEAAYSLTLKDSVVADAGCYKVKAVNSAGEVSQEIQVKVAEKEVKPV